MEKVTGVGMTGNEVPVACCKTGSIHHPVHMRAASRQISGIRIPLQTATEQQEIFQAAFRSQPVKVCGVQFAICSAVRDEMFGIRVEAS